MQEAFENAKGFRKAANIFMNLPDDQKVEFCMLPAEKQAGYLFVPDRRYKRFLRECPTDGSVQYITDTCAETKNKNKKEKWQQQNYVWKREKAEQEGYRTYREYLESQKKKREKK